jgi:hypothetical protein
VETKRRGVVLEKRSLPYGGFNAGLKTVVDIALDKAGLAHTRILSSIEREERERETWEEKGNDVG